MYAWPEESRSGSSKSPASASSSRLPISATTESSQTDSSFAGSAFQATHEFPEVWTPQDDAPFTWSTEKRQSADYSHLAYHTRSLPTRQYPPDPVATLTVTSSLDRQHEPRIVPMPDDSPRAVPDRIPLWTLAPGVGVLHGSVSASLGIRLSDFSASNLASKTNETIDESANKHLPSSIVGIKTSPVDVKKLEKLNVTRPPIEPISRPTSAAKKVPDLPGGQVPAPAAMAKRLTPPSSTGGSGEWPGRKSRVPTWKKGRKEVMEDVLEDVDQQQTDERVEDEERMIIDRLEVLDIHDEMTAENAVSETSNM